MKSEILTQHISSPITEISAITAIGEINVELSLSGGWRVDLYAYLTHDSGFSVLLNRPGISLADPFGSGTTSLDITFAHIALADSHSAIPNSGAVTGFFQPDARETYPDNVLATSPRTAFLSSFIGLPATGDWTLCLADVSTGDTMTMAGWTLTVTGVPEPPTALLGASASAPVLRRRRFGFQI